MLVVATGNVNCRLTSKYEKSAPKLREWMENVIPEGLTVFHFKSSHRVRLRTSNLAERVNREIKRLTHILRIVTECRVVS